MLGDKAAEAKIAFLDLSPNEVSVDVLRDQGFMKGFGSTKMSRHGDEDDPRTSVTSPPVRRRA
jgi:fructose transport system substrate-binding protein